MITKLGVYAAKATLVVLLIVGVMALSAWIMQWAWNLVIAGLFNGPVIEFWHAVAVVLLLSFVGNAVKSNVSTKS